jgi:hypothetical protein
MQYLFSCQPSYFELSVEVTRQASHRIVETVLHSFGKRGIKNSYKVSKFDEEQLFKNISNLCDSFMKFSENEVHDFIAAEDIMPALNAHRFLKEIRTRSGKLIWIRKS